MPHHSDLAPRGDGHFHWLGFLVALRGSVCDCKVSPDALPDQRDSCASCPHGTCPLPSRLSKLRGKKPRHAAATRPPPSERAGPALRPPGTTPFALCHFPQSQAMSPNVCFKISLC